MTETAESHPKSVMLGQPTLAIGLEYLTDHFRKQENLKDCLTLSWQDLAVAFLISCLFRLDSVLIGSSQGKNSSLPNRPILPKRKQVPYGVSSLPISLYGVDWCCQEQLCLMPTEFLNY